MSSSSLHIPQRLASVLSQNPKLHGATIVCLSEFSPWVSDNKLPFFPEYTDHGPNHINEVFITAEALIHDDAWKHFSPEDAAALILAILLHDCAMHLSEDGFIALIQSPEWSKPFHPHDTIPWAALWLDFLQEASRFDGRRLKKLFGDTEPIRPPPLNPNNMTKRDRLLIGEFLRRHHPRLAHEIALSGIPGPTRTPLKLQGLEKKFADIAGLIARSHGMDLRHAVELLPSDERREVRGIHAPFIMSVLRIADYIQIHAERAPEKLLNVRALQSPVSSAEWKKHHSIENIHNWHDDPEALYIKALPPDGSTYVGLKHLFASIQDELDEVWAVLGELYGRLPGLSRLGIMLRRVRSNLDNEKAFAASAEYVPGQSEFRTASADLLKLLVGPLYGDAPEVGIRELMQNAVDACRELSDFLRTHPETQQPTLTDQAADVTITLVQTDDNAATLQISDRGIGMTPETVKDYFLKAGASFRNSDTWKRQHTDNSGASRIARGGRFGIGVLAAFLLGDRIEVSTRHVTQSRGVTFSAGIDDDLVELRYADRPVGTTIAIKLAPKETLYLLNRHTLWDWYCLQSPSVLRHVQAKNKRNIHLAQRTTIANEGELLDHRWRRIRHRDYSDIQWSYWTQPGLDLACNGIRIPIARDHVAYDDPSDSDFDNETEDQPTPFTKIGFTPPCVSVFDHDGRLPLSLQRTSLTTEKFPFHDELYDDVCRDFIAYLLVNYPEKPSPDDHHWNTYRSLTDTGDALQWCPTWCSSQGWSISDASIFIQAKLDSIFIASHTGLPSSDCTQLSKYNIFPYRSRGASAYYNWLRTILKPRRFVGSPVHSLSIAGSRILLSKSDYSNLRKGGLVAKEYWAGYKEEWSSDEWIILRTGDCTNENSGALQQIASAPTSESFYGVSEWYPTKDQAPPFESRVGRLWKELVGRVFVPYNLIERRAVLAQTYSALKSYIEPHEAMLQEKTPSFEEINNRLIPTIKPSQGT